MNQGSGTGGCSEGRFFPAFLTGTGSVGGDGRRPRGKKCPKPGSRWERPDNRDSFLRKCRCRRSVDGCGRPRIKEQPIGFEGASAVKISGCILGEYRFVARKREKGGFRDISPVFRGSQTDQWNVRGGIVNCLIQPGPQNGSLRIDDATTND